MCQDSSMQHVWVGLSVSITMAFDRSTRWFEENTCSARAEDPRSPFLQSPTVFTKTMVQGPSRLANVGAGAFSTWDAVPHVTTSSSNCPFVFYMRACKCQLFTDEGSRRLLKRLNYCFSVLASATNQLI